MGGAARGVLVRSQQRALVTAATARTGVVLARRAAAPVTAAAVRFDEQTVTGFSGVAATVATRASSSLCTCLAVARPSSSPWSSSSSLLPLYKEPAVLASARRYASKKAGNKKKKKAGASDGPPGRSKKRQMLLEKRQAAAQAQAERQQTSKPEKAKDFSPKALKCDVLTAVEREEMYLRTQDNPIPEFYPGSILRVTYYEALSRNTPKRMVGLCIGRRNAKLGSVFTIRNVDEGVAFEAKFDLYSPLIAKIEVLELARRRRAKLYYLRDRPDKESYVSPSFQPIPPPKDGSVPIKIADPLRRRAN
ncbi:hypothetical protein PTSG_02766 [Salpingoeca rosetta]|uniref:50S ribosomal protein L19 n=1 Tax=Salpingoeca rosetta (strain ATCC 50818 / BSB-021) TaxID=946362 RepID=F2U392_SALR5|nr:uncharacterized protein PTSG_02766 [Salpingoeca rosetta]EGD82086.1 hypothetical protein PTSG_02766 [Salpingoeca rosetta]|eukprot:XP_004996269.1 hypothetical protein PTSG_02766 [Salpingoeca rosetta]